jgi:23S rRNA (guanosine2251-2'-O)-methyltransferase
MIIYGKQVFWHLLQNHPTAFEEVYLTKEINQNDFNKVSKLGVRIVRPDEKKAQALARGGVHQGFLAKVTPIEFKPLASLKKHDFLIVLVGVTDIGNIGSIVRTAYSLGAGGVILSGSRSFNLEGAVKSSAGAIFDLPIGFVVNPLDLINELKFEGFTLYGAVLDGKDERSFDRTEKRALFIGSEGEGLSNRIVEKLDKKITIQMKNNFDSLNVAVATAILIDRMNG